MSRTPDFEDESPLLSGRRGSILRSNPIAKKLPFALGCCASVVGIALGAAALSSIPGIIPSPAPTPVSTLLAAVSSDACPYVCSQGANVVYGGSGRRLDEDTQGLKPATSVELYEYDPPGTQYKYEPPPSVTVAPVSVSVPAVDAPLDQRAQATLPSTPATSSTPYTYVVPQTSPQPSTTAYQYDPPRSVSVPPPSVPSANQPAPSACLAGDSCVYGQGWCSKEGYNLPSQQPSGTCTKGECSGPASIPFYPNQTCSTPSAPGLDITALLGSVPGAIHDKLRNVLAINDAIRSALEAEGVEDVVIELDEEVGRSFRLAFTNLDVTWLVGCWPPQRYAVVGIQVDVPRGSVRVQSAGFDIVVTFENWRFTLNDLRANIACHGGGFVLESLGGHAGFGPIMPDEIAISGIIDIQCERPGSMLCFAINQGWLVTRARLFDALPSILAAKLNSFQPFVLPGPGCPGLLRNTMAVLGYSSKQCCEAPFAEDHSGVLIGGQFNGHVYGLTHPVTSVVCSEDDFAPGTFRARCDTVPGGYYKTASGSCREGDELPPPPPKIDGSEIWTAIHHALVLEPWFELLMLIALLCCCAGCAASCCYPAATGADSESDLDEQS